MIPELKFLNEGRTRKIEYNAISYEDFDLLLKDNPALIENAQKLASISNFLFGGLQFRLIENAEEYKKKYNKQIENEKKSKETTLTQYGIFDVSVIKPAAVADSILTYFVESTNFGIPFVVTCVLSNNYKKSRCSYEKLPYLHGKTIP